MSSCISSVIIVPQVQWGGLALTQYLIFIPFSSVNEKLVQWLHLAHAIPEIKAFRRGVGGGGDGSKAIDRDKIFTSSALQIRAVKWP